MTSSLDSGPLEQGLPRKPWSFPVAWHATPGNRWRQLGETCLRQMIPLRNLKYHRKKLWHNWADHDLNKKNKACQFNWNAKHATGRWRPNRVVSHFGLNALRQDRSNPFRTSLTIVTTFSSSMPYCYPVPWPSQLFTLKLIKTTAFKNAISQDDISTKMQSWEMLF